MASSAPVRTTVPVLGMTCRTCELRLQKHVGRLPGVVRVAASAPQGRIVVESRGELAPWALERAVRAAGYEIGETPWLSRDGTVWGTALVGGAAVVVLAVLANAAGITDLASGLGDLGQGGLAIALLIGLAAGVSTCAALVGGLVLALTASFEAGLTVDDTGAVPARPVVARMRPALVFLAGRVAGYGVLGALLGAIGATVALPPQATAVLMVVVAVVMTVLGTRLMEVSPRIAAWSPTLPVGLARTLGLTGGEAASGAGYSDARAAALGAASFFLPCGFTQAVQVFALSTGSPVYAGALLATFALGTVPGLIALAGLPVVVPTSVRPTLLRLVGVVVIGFAVLNGTAGLRLAGFALPSFGGPGGAVAAGALNADGTQSIATTQAAWGYEPQNVVIYAGVPTKWTITSETEASCSVNIVVPALGIQRTLSLGDNHIDLPALQAGVVRYTCAMGMFGGQITVVDRPTSDAGGPAGG